MRERLAQPEGHFRDIYARRMDRPQPPFVFGPDPTNPVLAVGDQGFTAQIGADNWRMVGALATVVGCAHATKLLVSFTIQSGVARRRDFYRIGQLDG